MVYQCEKVHTSWYISRKSDKYSEEKNPKNNGQLLFEWRGSLQDDIRLGIMRCVDSKDITRFIE